MDKHQLLTQTRDAFTDWRTSHQRGAATPQPLRDMAIELIQYFPVGQICQHLSVSYASLKLWEQLAQTPQFVALPDVEPQENHALSLSLSVDEQQQLTLQGPISPQFVAQLVEALRQ